MTNATASPDLGKKNPVAPGLRIVSAWHALTLVRQFAMIGAVVLLAGSLVIGLWVSRKIEDGVTQNTAVATALYMESFVAPVTQELAGSDALSAAAGEALEGLFRDTALGERVVSFKIWKRGGLIAHAADPALVGQRFGETDNLARAFAGEVIADFDDLGDAEDAGEKAWGIPLLEIYSPIREAYTGRIIAVAEFYERAEGLEADLAAARNEGWLVVGLVMGTMGMLLFGIVAGGGRTIRRQRESLERRVEELADLAEQNRSLRTRIQTAAGRAAEMNERYLRRLSADLHDGPTQMLALAALRLDGLSGTGAKGDAACVVAGAVNEAIREIRQLCRGLAMPELEGLAVGDVIAQAAEGHRRRTDSAVDVDVHLPDLAVSHPQRICIYRFVQEGLSNAFRHAGAMGQSVTARHRDGVLRVTVQDAGTGLPENVLAGDTVGLGLRGLKDRVETLGGTLCVENSPGGGARLEIMLDINPKVN